MDENQVIKRALMRSAPLAFAALTLLHSHHPPSELGEDITGGWLCTRRSWS